jgi:hypothetical protein
MAFLSCMGATNSCSKAAEELLSESVLGSVHKFPSGFQKALFSSGAALEQLLYTTARGV